MKLNLGEHVLPRGAVTFPVSHCGRGNFYLNFENPRRGVDVTAVINQWGTALDLRAHLTDFLHFRGFE
jgi:hypothetical protein